MENVIGKVIAYLLVIFLGFGLKNIGIFSSKDSRVLAKISFYITLPCAIIYSFKEFSFYPSLTLIAIYGLGLNLIVVMFILWLLRKSSKENKTLFSLYGTSFNIGSFALPFLSGVYSPSALIYLTMFDVGNSMYCNGIGYSISEIQTQKNSSFNLKTFIRNLLTTPTFVTYLVMLLFLILNVSLPTVVFDIAQVPGQANVFIVMFMFGLLFTPQLSKSSWHIVGRVLGIRYGIMTLVSVGMWFLFPIELEAKKVLITAIFSPMTSITITYAMRLKCNEEIASFLSSITIPLSLGVFFVLQILFSM